MAPQSSKAKRSTRKRLASRSTGPRRLTQKRRLVSPPDEPPSSRPTTDGNSLVQIYSGPPLSAVEQVLQRLREGRHRITTLRRFLLERLQSSHGPLSVADIIQLASKSDLRPNKTTIYRELYFLVQQGIVSEVDFLDGMKRYEFIAHDGHHHHMVCTRCGSVECAHVCFDTSAVLGEIAKQSSFKVQHHVLEFFGLCAECQER